MSYFTVSLRYEIRHDLVSNLIHPFSFIIKKAIKVMDEALDDDDRDLSSITLKRFFFFRVNEDYLGLVRFVSVSYPRYFENP